MLKQEISYINFNGEKVSETYYFNYNEPELLEMDADIPDGLQGLMNRIKDGDGKSVVKFIKKLILGAVGRKSGDGSVFEKSEEISKRFSQTNAYPKLFMDIASDPDKAEAFMEGVMPGLTDEAKAKIHKEVNLELGRDDKVTQIPTESSK